MLPRLLARLMDAQDGWSQTLGDAIQPWLHRFFHAVIPLRDLLNGRWLGHPLHAALTDAPVGILFIASTLDVLGQPAAADIALLLGILAMLAAAVAGLADYGDTDGRARTRATLHATLMVVTFVVYLVSLALRYGGDGGRTPAIWIAGLGFLLLIAATFVGGDVAYVLGNMVNRHAFRGPGLKWLALEPAEFDERGAIPEGRPIRAKLGANQLVLVRQGERILALHDTCAHASGSLSEGRLVGDAVECPLHQSRYRLADGRVIQGPSVYDQPAYEVRRRTEGGWEARRQQSS